MTRTTRRLAHRIGHRGAVLICLAFIDLIYGGTMLFGQGSASPTYAYAAEILPLTAWGAIWAVIGIVCIVQAFMHRDFVAYACAQAVKVSWAIVAISGWLSHQIPHGQISAAVWIFAAAWVGVVSTWPEQPRSPRR